MHRYTHWVFDLDGTLTVHQHDFESIRVELGIPQGTLILEYLEAMPAAEAARLRRRLDAWEQALVSEVEPAAGAVELVTELHARGVSMGVLTRNTRHNAITSLAHLGLDRFIAPDHVLGREDATPKPAPDGIHWLLARWQAHSDDCVMVGDYRLDLEAGRNAGVATAHVAAADADAWPALTDHRFTSLTGIVAAL